MEAVYKKFIYQSWHRGTRENDLLLGPFADNCLSALPNSLLNCYEQLLQESDEDIYQWLTQVQEAPPQFRVLIKQILCFHHSLLK